MLRLFDLSLQFNGFPIKEAQAELQKIISFSDKEYEVFLENKKLEIVQYHIKNNPFYQKFVGNNTSENWNNLPIMTKAAFQRPLIERLSNGFMTRNVYVNKTSGSAGDPFIFAKDKFCHALTWVNVTHCFSWFEINFNSSLQARFYGIPLDFIGNQKERIKDFMGNRYRFSVFDLSDEVLEKVLKKFQKKKFYYINGYTSSVVLFAKFLQKKNLQLSTICPTLKVCVVTSEMLFEDDKILMEKQFGIPVVNEYGASELDLIAFQNPAGEWKINSTTLFVEILDEENQVLPYGKEGRIVITSLYNKAHPFIRYDIGDVGILDEKSTLKNPILKQLIGRTNDIALLPSGKKSPGLTFYYVTKSIIEDDGNVKEFVIKQTKIDTFEIEYVSQNEMTSSQILKIEKAITTYLEIGLTFLFIRKEKIERSKSGKLKQFVSLLK